jgi:hypothetical protein
MEYILQSVMFTNYHAVFMLLIIKLRWRGEKKHDWDQNTRSKVRKK